MATDLVNTKLFDDLYYSKGFGLNVTLHSLYITFGGKDNMVFCICYLFYVFYFIVIINLIEYFIQKELFNWILPN